MTASELDKQLVDSIALLSVPGIGRGRFIKLISAFRTPEAVLSAGLKQLEAVNGISSNLATTIKNSVDFDSARQIAARVEQMGWNVLYNSDDKYPKPLANIPSRPPILFHLGLDWQEDEKAIAIVGTRRCTEGGREFTKKLASDLALAGVTVVSGMAEGIDAAAHTGALEAGGKTIAVWGNSLEIVYPPSNKGLARTIIDKGAVYSEYLPGTTPDRSTFPERNRIIAGLSEGVVVIEAGQKSGALITADLALEFSRDLFAMPGHPGARMSQGTNQLIKDGARLITSVDDIFSELPRLKGKVMLAQKKQLLDMTDSEKKIVALFSDGAMQLDQIARGTEMTVTDVMQFLLALELKGVVRELSGKRFILAE